MTLPGRLALRKRDHRPAASAGRRDARASGERCSACPDTKIRSAGDSRDRDHLPAEGLRQAGELAAAGAGPHALLRLRGRPDRLRQADRRHLQGGHAGVGAAGRRQPRQHHRQSSTTCSAACATTVAARPAPGMRCWPSSTARCRPGSQIKTVQPGTIVVLAKLLTNSLDPKQFNGDYILRDRPQLEQHGHRVPQVLASRTAMSVRVSRRSTSTSRRRGASSFQADDGRGSPVAARAGPARAASPWCSTTSCCRGRRSTRSSIRRASTARTVPPSTEISTAEQAKALAAVLESGPLPFRLVPLLQTQVQSG